MSKDRHAIAVADGGRDGEVRFFGEIGSDGGSVRRFVRKLEPPATRQAIRWTEPAPLVNTFGVCLDEQRSRVSPRSRLGEKLTYIANQWDGLLAFLHDGRVEMGNNFVENRIRPIKLTAKNALFAGHDEGARAWGRIASLIQTCKMNEPYAWLKDTLEKIAAGHPNSRIDELLPWNFKPTSS